MEGFCGVGRCGGVFGVWDAGGAVGEWDGGGVGVFLGWYGGRGLVERVRCVVCEFNS